MKYFNFFIFLICLSSNVIFAQTETITIPFIDNEDLVSVNVEASKAIYLGVESLRVVEDVDSTEVRFVKIKNLNFKSGSIEIDLAGKPAEGASAQARGFVGIAFRINDDNSKFECIYLRPTNGRANNQVRRNHSVQYISVPDFPWFKLRKEFPKKYETYVDLATGEWTKVKIEINGESAKLYVHGNSQPTLIVNDLKLGADGIGDIGLWIGPGTEAYFSNLRLTKSK